MQITKANPIVQITKRSDTNADRQARFRARHPKEYRENNARRMRKSRAAHIPAFIGIDSEGIGRGDNHRAILLGCGEKHLVARDMRKGLHWKEVFEFLYGCFEANPEDTVYVGFYLRYDFNEWLKTLPVDKAHSLLTVAGKAARVAKDPKREKFSHGKYYPVRCDGWEFDMPAGYRSLKIRPRVCTCLEDRIPCVHEQMPYMHICDAGPYFQTSFLRVLQEWPEADRLWTDKEFKIVEYGKNNLRTVTRFSKKMIEYNQLENEILARIMRRVAEGLHELGIKLPRDSWYGPGPVAATWLSKNGGVKNRDLVEIDGMAGWLDLCRLSYFGGWFEIFSHGIIPGVSYNYDINSAYPYATTKLPHICDQCRTRCGSGRGKSDNGLMLLHCTVRTQGNRIGAVPYRDAHGGILRPNISKGWYWAHELDAANNAGLIKDIDYHEWVEFLPCNHARPFSSIGDLYDMRKRVDKASPLGRAIKLVINSVYGKFAQSVGGAPFNNWFYASYITSHCRTQILNAIATHPHKSEAVLMVATDGICFDSPHPTLPTGKDKRLGDWEETTYEDLCLFKPGVYWDKKGKADLKIKTRGVPAAQFAEGIEQIEYMFRMCLDKKCYPGSVMLHSRVNWTLVDMYRDTIPDAAAPEYFVGPYYWPQFIVTLPFQMTSCKQALQRGKWETAGRMQENPQIVQSSYPHNKRGDLIKPKRGGFPKRFDSTIIELDPAECETRYYKDPTIRYPTKDFGFGVEMGAFDEIREIASVARDRQANYDLDIDDIEWETVWDGGPV